MKAEHKLHAALADTMLLNSRKPSQFDGEELTFSRRVVHEGSYKDLSLPPLLNNKSTQPP